MILAFDVGGTKLAMANFELKSGRWTSVKLSRFETEEHRALGGFPGMLRHHFGGKVPSVDAVGIGVAGPVMGKKASLTNLAWEIDAEVLTSQLQAPVFLLNDLVAHGHSVPYLDPDTAFVTLQEGQPQDGPSVLAAAGTGLGEAIMLQHAGKLLVLPSEGGHATFAPVGSRDGELAEFLRKRYDGHVSWERVVSGLDGFRNLFDFFDASGEIEISPQVVAKLAGQRDIGAEIIAAGAAGEPYAQHILGWFSCLYGAEAANLALKVFAGGGVYLAGGIAPRIFPLNKDKFMHGFTTKGRFSSWLKSVPVKLITEANAALIGAAHFAASHLN